MKKVQIKRLIAILISIAIIIITSSPIAYAGSIPSKYSDYVLDGRVDYADLHNRYFKGNAKKEIPSYTLTEPRSSFTVTVYRGGNFIANANSDSGQILYAQVGDTLTIQNTSEAGSGRSLSKVDFQISDGTSIIYSTTLLGSINVNKIPTNIEGAYNIYLNVMDNEAMTRTEGWGNWAYNGTHVSPGTNPG
ncbi:MAG: hypothetical protein ACYCYE_06440, partial [Clostridia bacterium]